MSSSSSRTVLVVAALVAALAVLAAAQTSQPVTSLPGLAQLPSFGMWTGYLSPTPERHLWYWFVEAAESAATAPVVLWLQGGPGCSSSLGFWTENGPFEVQSDLTLALRNTSLNQLANVIYLDSPAGVGYSWKDDPQAPTGDNQTMADSYQALLQFFALFPQYQQNDFYVSGESYGGHYVPQLAWTIAENNARGAALQINLQGAVVGNPYSDAIIDGNAVAPFLLGHSLVSLAAYQTADELCGGLSRLGERVPASMHAEMMRGNVLQMLRPELHHRFFPDETPACKKALKQLFNQVGPLINQYDIYAGCTNGSSLPCMNYTALIAYLSDPAVQQALAANSSGHQWQPCSDINFTESWPSVVGLYAALAAAGIKRLTVYSGDVTFNVGFLGTQQWVTGLNLPVVHNWNYWLSDNQVAGYRVVYDSLSYVTVLEAGHMVPQYQPARYFEFIKTYLAGGFSAE